MFSTIPTHRKPKIFSKFPDLIAGESTRHGGVSPAPFASLNLGLYTDDDPGNVEENRRRFFHDLGLDIGRVAGGYQVHGSEVLHVEKPGQYEGYDAFMAARRGLFLTVTVADCVPVLVFDSQKQAVAGIHAGWRGTAAGIVRKTIGSMQDQFGTQPEDCYVYIGTCIDECSYEVGAEVADFFSTPFKRWDTGRQKYFLDLKAANRDQLIQSGIPAGQIEVSPYSTVTNNSDYFSHRLEQGQTGRMLGLIGMK